MKMALAVPRSALGNQLATMRALAGKDGDSAKPTMKRSRNMLITTGMKAKEAGKDRPKEDGQEIAGPRAEAVQQGAAGDLAGNIRPTESREDVPQLDGRD